MYSLVHNEMEKELGRGGGGGGYFLCKYLDDSLLHLLPAPLNINCNIVIPLGYMYVALSGKYTYVWKNIIVLFWLATYSSSKCTE